MPALVITTDGDVKPASVPASQADHLSWMYERISCSTVDVVRLPRDLDLWVDDEGLLNDSPVNPIATLWARYFGGLDVVIFGNAILAKHDGHGNTVDLSDREATAAMLTLVKILEMAASTPNSGVTEVAVIEAPPISLN